jgi:micrococcal nuclease
LKTRFCLFFFLLVAFGLLLLPQNPAADPARVVGVSDGDTIRVRLDDGLEKKVRLIGINAPELDDPRGKVQFLARMADRFTFSHLYGKDIWLTYDWEREDKYGRTLAFAWVGNGTLFNEYIIREGFASAFLKYPFRKDYQERFRAAEVEARAGGKGLWHRGEYPEIPAADAQGNPGKLLCVVFNCTEVRIRERFVLLLAETGNFQAFIPLESLPLFPDVETFKGRFIKVTGFLEDFHGRPEMRIFFPSQLKTNQAHFPVSKGVPLGNVPQFFEKGH